jgi:hypothetical protein
MANCPLPCHSLANSCVSRNVSEFQPWPERVLVCWYPWGGITLYGAFSFHWRGYSETSDVQAASCDINADFAGRRPFLESLLGDGRIHSVSHIAKFDPIRIGSIVSLRSEHSPRLQNRGDIHAALHSNAYDFRCTVDGRGAFVDGQNPSRGCCIHCLDSYGRGLVQEKAHFLRASVLVLGILLFTPYANMYDLVLLALRLSWVGLPMHSEGWFPKEMNIFITLDP